jgi:Fe-S cluster assembly protein SufB
MLTEKVINYISKEKKDPEYIREIRKNALKVFNRLHMPDFGPPLNDIDFNDINYYKRAIDDIKTSWDDIPSDIKDTYDKLGIIKAEQDRLVSGVAAQYESEVIYHQIQDSLKKQGVIFLDTDTAYKKYPEIFKKYFGKIVPMNDNKFAALNSAVFSGGSFIYVPKNVIVEIPLQAYFRINSEKMGQFERTLIIVDDGAKLHYVEGCTAPIYSTNLLHAAVVEIYVGENAKMRYSTIQNWSTNVYNLVTKRAKVQKNGVMEWVDGNIGSKVSMKYPACILDGEGAKGEVLSLSVADKNQNQDTGTRIIHNASNTKSVVTAKSISKNGGITNYRGLIRVNKGVKNASSTVQCDSLLLDDISVAASIPTIDCKNYKNIKLSHEASVSKIDVNKLFYLMSRGISEEQASSMLVRGFIDNISKELPMEYAVELNRLVQLQFK